MSCGSTAALEPDVALDPRLIVDEQFAAVQFSGGPREASDASVADGQAGGAHGVELLHLAPGDHEDAAARRVAETRHEQQLVVSLSTEHGS